ncbi:MAG TPA: DUF2125 domain-containing protein [Alphaproteobacteria bacterium]|nr:DUF2125 domain-containing protein [Alphaproteobacteria bacterium]
MRPSRTLAVAGAAAILAVAYAAYWFYAAGMVRDGLEAWIAETRQAGTEIQLSRLSVDGFPFAITATATDVRIARPDGLTWETALVEASARPWSWRRIGVRLPDGQRLLLAEIPDLSAAAEGGSGELLLDAGGRLAGAEMTFETVAMALPGIAELATAETVAGAWAQKVPEGGGTPVVTAELAIESLALPQAPLPDLGAVVQNAELDLTVTGPLPPRLTGPQLAAWRNRGGTVAIDLMAVDWGPLSARGAGTAALDAELQPTASVTADVTGFLETVDALVAAGLLESRPASYAKAGLSLLAGAPDESGLRVLTLPAVLENRTLSLGPLALGSVPRIDWPEEDGP